MTDSAPPTITVAFGRTDHDLALRTIVAMLDMTLTRRGATIQHLEVVGLGIGEVVEAIATSGTMTSAELRDDPEGARLTIEHTAAIITFEPERRELTESAFCELTTLQGKVEMRAYSPPRPSDDLHAASANTLKDRA